MRVIPKQRNKPLLPGNKIDKRFIKDQIDPKQLTTRGYFAQQAVIGQQASGIVGRTEKQAVQL